MRANAAKFIAKDLRDNKEKRRGKIKNRSGVFNNQIEYLKMSTRRATARLDARDRKLDGVLFTGDESDKEDDQDMVLGSKTTGKKAH